MSHQYQNAIDLIKQCEGFVPRAYRCPAGVWTIGYGQTGDVRPNDTITELEASKFVQASVEGLADQISKIVTVRLTDLQMCALIDFAYNLGIGNLRSSTLLKMINNNDLINASNQFSRWVYANHKKLPGLVKRREAERQMFIQDL